MFLRGQALQAAHKPPLAEMRVIDSFAASGTLRFSGLFLPSIRWQGTVPDNLGGAATQEFNEG